MKKSLIEGFKSYWKEYSKFRKVYRLKIEDKLGDILRILGHDYAYIENFELMKHEKQIIVSYVFEDMELYPTDFSHRVEFVPIEWLDMSKKEIAADIKIKKELERKAQEEHEKRERRKYERLKRKYEG